MIKKLFKGFIYFLGICALISILAAACEDEEATYVETEQGTVMVIPDEPDSEVQIVEPEQKEDYDFIFLEGPNLQMADHASYDFANYITGIVQNNTDKDYDYLQISFTLYDEQGNVIDTAFTNVNNIKAGGTWKFEAMFFEENVASWELDEITGW